MMSSCTGTTQIAQHRKSPPPPNLRKNEHPSNIRIKDYDLNEKQAVHKKIEACSRPPLDIKRCDSNNYVITFNTASFEIAREAIRNCLRVDTANRKSRSHEYIYDLDQKGNFVSEIIKMKSWAVIDKTKLPAAEHLFGTCSVVISLYKTRTNCLVNGKSAATFMDLLRPALQALVSRNLVFIDSMNTQYKNALSRCHYQLTCEENKVPDSVNPSSLSPVPDLSMAPNPRRIKDKPSDKQLNTKDARDKGESRNGDVPQAPLPKPSSPTNSAHTCPGCNRNIRNRAVQCDMCDVWKHYKCEKLDNLTIEEIESGADYTCKACIAILQDEPQSSAYMQTQQSPKRSACLTTMSDTPEAVISTPPLDGAQSSTDPTPHIELQTSEPNSQLNNPNPSSTTTQDPLLSRTQSTRAEAIRNETTQSTAQKPVTQVLQSSYIKPMVVKLPPLGSTGSQMPTPTPIDVAPMERKESPGSPGVAMNNQCPKMAQVKIVAAPITQPALPKTFLSPSSSSHLPNEAETLLANREKQVKTKERALKLRENALKKQELELLEKIEQYNALKTLTSSLETKIKNLQEENRLLKMKLLASEDVYDPHNRPQNQQPLQSNPQPVLSNPQPVLSNPHPAPSNPQNNYLSEMCTAITTLALSNIASASQRQVENSHDHHLGGTISSLTRAVDQLNSAVTTLTQKPHRPWLGGTYQRNYTNHKNHYRQYRDTYNNPTYDRSFSEPCKTVEYNHRSLSSDILPLGSSVATPVADQHPLAGAEKTYTYIDLTQDDDVPEELALRDLIDLTLDDKPEEPVLIDLVSNNPSPQQIETNPPNESTSTTALKPSYLNDLLEVRFPSTCQITKPKWPLPSSHVNDPPPQQIPIKRQSPQSQLPSMEQAIHNGSFLAPISLNIPPDLPQRILQ